MKPFKRKPNDAEDARLWREHKAKEEKAMHDKIRSEKATFTAIFEMMDGTTVNQDHSVRGGLTHYIVAIVRTAKECAMIEMDDIRYRIGLDSITVDGVTYTASFVKSVSFSPIVVEKDTNNE